MIGQTVSEILKAHLSVRKASNPLYSSRSFARDLQMSPSQVSMVLSGKKGISRQKAVQIAKTLKLNSVEQDYFISLSEKQYGRSTTLKRQGANDARKIAAFESGLSFSKDSFSPISEWYHMAILQIMQMKDYPSVTKREGEAEFLARSLNLTTSVVSTALEKLSAVGAVEKEAHCHAPVSSFVMVNGSEPNAVIRKFHRQVIHQALNVLNFQDSSENAFKTTLLNMSSQDFHIINEELSRFCKSLMIRFGKKRDSEIAGNTVYALSSQFFKLAEIKDE